MTAAPHSSAMTTEELFRQHAAFVGRFLARLGVPAENVADVLQEVFLVVHRQGGYRPGIAKPTSYLAGIALHAARKHRRRGQTARARHSETRAEQLPNAAAVDPVQRLHVQRVLERLQLALDQLSEEHRTALVLVEIEGESCLSVAAALGVPVGTIYSRVHIARKKLQLALGWVDDPRPTTSKERRMEHAPSLTMLTWLGLDPLFRRSEAARLLQVAREHPPAIDVSNIALARHRELVQSNASLPSWAAHYAPHSATWFSVLSLGSVATVASLTAAGTAAALMLSGSRPHGNAAKPEPPAITQPSSQPLAAASERRSEPSPTAARSLEESPAVVAKHRRQRSAPVSSSAAAHGQKTRTVSEPANADDETTTQEVSAPRATDPRQATTQSLSTPALSATRVAANPTDSSARPPAEQPRGQIHASAAAASRAPEPTPATPSGSPTPDALQEMRDIANAEHLLVRDPARALQLARTLRARFPEGYLCEERAYIEVMALSKLARSDEARAQAVEFLQRYPDGPYSQRVRGAVWSAPH